MNKNPIIIVDNDDGDIELLKIAFTELNVENEIIVFNDGCKFLEYMKVEKGGTFFILCDINMPKVTGIELKKIIQEDERLRLKCVPFILLSTSRATASVMEAYSYGVNGYFIKPTGVEKLMEMLLAIITYWSESEHPNL